MSNHLIITEWAFDSYSDLVARHVVVPDKRDPRHNYKILRDDALLLKNYGTKQASAKFKNDKFWEKFGDGQELYEMKWHNFGHTQSQLRLHVYVRIPEVYLLQAYEKSDPRKQQREMIKSEAHVYYIDRGQFKFRGELK